MSRKFTTKNVSVEWKFDLKRTLLENFSNRQWASMSQNVVKQMILTKIEKGISPVEGVRMFQKYKDPSRYPGDLKQSNKPNLKLEGTMLSYYESRPGTDPMEIVIGIHKDAPPKELIKVEANNQGTQNAKSQTASAIARGTRDRKLQRIAASTAKGIPARPFIPNKNQSFTKDIMLEIRKLFAYCLNQAINRGKNK